MKKTLIIIFLFLSLSASAKTIDKTLAFNSNKENITGYKLYKNGVELWNGTDPNKLLYEVPLGLNFSGTHTIVLTSYDSDGNESVKNTPYIVKYSWNLNCNMPIISGGNFIDKIIWNDPSVLKEGQNYKMWFSGGFSAEGVSIYSATSLNGIDWNVNTEPILSPSNKENWDDKAVETPVVINVNNIYHMYYSGNTYNSPPGAYQIGHATSTDGVNWIKDPNNPIIKKSPDLFKWGFFTVAEPGIILLKNKFYLYFTTFKTRPGYEGIPDLGAMQGICLAISTDGSNFIPYDADKDGHFDAVLTQSKYYPVEKKYIGYSTPFALVDAVGTIHLFYDVVRYPYSGDWRQVALAHSISQDGINFTEIETDIIKIGDFNWLGHEVRSPSVIEENNRFKMWFAGHSNTNWTDSGIGYAEYNLDFQ